MFPKNNFGFIIANEDVVGGGRQQRRLQNAKNSLFSAFSASFASVSVF